MRGAGRAPTPADSPGLLAAPVAWATQFQITCALAEWACPDGDLLPLHLTVSLFLLIAMAGSGLAWHNWRGGGRHWPADADEGAAARSRLMSALGLMLGGLFTWLIVAQWLSVVFLQPCPT